MFTLSTCRPMTGGGSPKPAAFASDASNLEKSKADSEPTASFPDTKHVYHFYGPKEWTTEEKKYFDAATEWAKQTNQWDGYEFEITPTSNIPVTRNKFGNGISFAQISSTETEIDDDDIRGSVSLKLAESPRDTTFRMTMWKGEWRNREMEREVVIGPGYIGVGEFVTKEGKITVQPTKFSSSPDTQHVHQFYGTGHWTPEEQNYFDAAIEWAKRTNQWHGFEFEITPTLEISVVRPEAHTANYKVATQISSTKTENQSDIRGMVVLGLSANPRETSLFMTIVVAERQNPKTIGQVFISPKPSASVEFGIKEGKIMVIDKIKGNN
ncbi:hypothetical protein EV361DRAFT_948103 [Lentinula raphanica]|uniref:Uncharacterized protein n=1 Tax=Lentinula raphanica TaxID=153919 RepID=A0AA38P6C1_9AGAR|nr:hypothetical protein F5878DRAFT_643022 [Lentinula raphanica]KAJ3973215.1 hypothetical protein EV361DRAFT_948103 [Lentinula raphanica]